MAKQASQTGGKRKRKAADYYVFANDKSTGERTLIADDMHHLKVAVEVAKNLKRFMAKTHKEFTVVRTSTVPLDGVLEGGE